MNQWAAAAAVAAGGALGAVARFLVGTWFLQRFGPAFPWGTFAINMSGAFAIGVLMQLAQTRLGFSPYVKVFVATGILGGYTTFSAFAYETYVLSRDAFSLQSVWYGFGSVVAGVAAVLVGIVCARAVFP